MQAGTFFFEDGSEVTRAGRLSDQEATFLAPVMRSAYALPWNKSAQEYLDKKDWPGWNAGSFSMPKPPNPRPYGQSEALGMSTSTAMETRQMNKARYAPEWSKK